MAKEISPEEKAALEIKKRTSPTQVVVNNRQVITPSQLEIGKQYDWMYEQEVVDAQTDEKKIVLKKLGVLEVKSTNPNEKIFEAKWLEFNRGGDNTPALESTETRSMTYFGIVQRTDRTWGNHRSYLFHHK